VLRTLQKILSLATIKDLLTESDYWAEENGHIHITNGDVQQAIDNKTRRLDKIREKLYEHIDRGTVMIDTEGKVTGQINALSVLQLGEFSFGQPSPPALPQLLVLVAEKWSTLNVRLSWVGLSIQKAC
jgi:predicted ATP-dependent protease